MKKLNTVTWGIPAFDKASGGLPANLMSVVETPDYHSGNVVLGQFLWNGLKKGERCVLVTFDSAETFLENFALWEIDFKKYLVTEQFLLLNYQPNVAYEAGLTHDFDSIFNEIKQMCGDGAPTRIGLQQVDTLVNLNNQILINTSTQKLSAAAREAGPTILGQFVNFGDKTHHDLAIAFQKTMFGYFSLHQPDHAKVAEYIFTTKKLPWFSFNKQATPVALAEGEGFRNVQAYSQKVA